MSVRQKWRDNGTDEGEYYWENLTPEEEARVNYGGGGGFFSGLGSMLGGAVSGLPGALGDMKGGLAVALGGPTLGGAITGALPGGVGALNGAGSFAGDIAGAGGAGAVSGGAQTGNLASLAPNSYSPNALGTMTDSPIAWDTGAGAQMPPASAELDPTFGKALQQTGAGSWSQPPMAPMGAASGMGFGALSGLLSNPALLGAALGAGAGAIGGGNKPAGSVTSVQDVPDWLKPYVTANLNQGASLMGQASQGANLLPGAQAQLSKTINGDYLNPSSNPYFQPYVQDLMGQVGSQFAGTYGGAAGANVNNSGYQEGLARTMTNAVLPLYNQAYTGERTNQINAASNAPAFAGQSAQAVFSPQTSFGSLLPNLRTQSQPYFQNSFGSALSGALGGAAIGKAFGA